jgi:hypothetical protein
MQHFDALQGGGGGPSALEHLLAVPATPAFHPSTFPSFHPPSQISTLCLLLISHKPRSSGGKNISHLLK